MVALHKRMVTIEILRSEAKVLKSLYEGCTIEVGSLLELLEDSNNLELAVMDESIIIDGYLKYNSFFLHLKECDNY